MRLPTSLLAVTVLAGGVVIPWQPARAEQPGRYAMQPTDGGFLRLDTATGEMSLCQRTAGSFECRPVKDDRDLQGEVARLAKENAELRAEIKRLEELPGHEPRKLELPSEQDVDKALSYVERMYKKFRDKIRDLERTERDGVPVPPPAPGKEPQPPAKGTL
jgi:hypothetical protein